MVKKKKKFYAYKRFLTLYYCPFPLTIIAKKIVSQMSLCLILIIYRLAYYVGVYEFFFFGVIVFCWLFQYFLVMVSKETKHLKKAPLSFQIKKIILALFFNFLPVITRIKYTVCLFFFYSLTKKKNDKGYRYINFLRC